jgi:hypothetical protein
MAEMAKNHKGQDAPRRWKQESLIRHGLLLALVVSTVRLAVAQEDTASTWTLSQQFGRSTYRKCELQAGVFQGNGSVELRCTPNVKMPRTDITARRKLTTGEVDALTKLSQASDLYDGGHGGFGPPTGSEGPWETLTVRCCARREFVVIVTQGNGTLQSGSNRHRLLQQLYAWQDELKKSAKQRAQR